MRQSRRLVIMMLETYEPLEGSSCPPSPSSPRLGRTGSGACGGIPGTRWLSNSFKEKRKGSIKLRADWHTSSRKQGREVQLDRDSSMGSDRESDRGVPAYAGWVYHVGTSSLGYSFCSVRFLVIKGKYVTMFKRNPVQYPRAVRHRFRVIPYLSLLSSSNACMKCLLIINALNLHYYIGDILSKICKLMLPGLLHN